MKIEASLRTMGIEGEALSGISIGGEYRVYQFLVNSRDKANFEKHMKEQKKVTGLTMDETICILVPI